MKIMPIGVIILLIFTTVVASASVKINENIVVSSEENEIVDIRVAIFTDEKETDENFYSEVGRTRYLIWALRDYSWKVEDALYNLKPSLFSTKDLLDGKLTKENYDVILVSPEHVMGQVFSTGFSKMPKNKKIRDNIVSFIEEGGGYYGSCAGAEISGSVKNEPKSFFQRMWAKSCYGISITEHEFDMAVPMVSQFLGIEPETIGINGYIQYSGFNSSDPIVNYYNGFCLNVKIRSNHPIFKDYLSDTRKIRWVSGPPLLIPDNPDRDINAIAFFPDEDPSDNESLAVHHWRYDGGIRGLVRAFLKSFKSDVDSDYFGDFGIGNLYYAFVYSEDWDMLEDKVIETDFANKPFMISEIYPNQNKARLVLCTGHPEMNVWWGGHIEEVEDTDHNTIFDGFHHWADTIPMDETTEDEFSYNYWIIRRSVAYASQKVPDNHLPSIYGASQVCDFEENVTGSNFTVYANSKTTEGIVSLDLFYRYSADNSSWTDWILFATDSDESNGWGWEFNSPNGTGYYHFYSLRNVEYEGYVETEKIPPGPDAIVFVEVD